MEQLLCIMSISSVLWDGDKCFPQGNRVTLCEEGTHCGVAVAYQVVSCHYQRRQMVDMCKRAN